ncbi:unnamed protein product [Acanthoscelides obtectus]|uniref:Uncharacterized protein n=1 Tax=Acanthoscelides obtectus TaxID=200917 RepID=A0A9P0LJD4_ACAOB|nr:unnamed protein product [Acanthoscelides obtectus]CAK1641182.1 Peroxisome assembly protein 12 [Acanthoscelides obtectus]
MAENAANLTATLQVKPSIFEIIAQKSLNDILQPAFRKLAEVLATNFPKRFAWLNNYCEESFVVINWLLQYNYLKNYGKYIFVSYDYLLVILNNVHGRGIPEKLGAS